MSGMYSNARKAYPQYYKDVDGPDGDLLASMSKRDPTSFHQALEDGADPDCRELIATKRIMVSPLATICRDLPLQYPNKLDYVRPLVEKGADLLALRQQNGPESFTESVLYMGFRDYQEGDEKCAAYLLARLIAGDILRDKTYHLKDILSKIFATVGGSLPNNDDDRVRVQYAEAITQNQHALVDYVATSTDPIATYLRSQSGHPSSAAWVKKIDPVNHTEYPRPKSDQSFGNYMSEANSFSGLSRHFPIAPTPFDFDGLPRPFPRFDLSEAFKIDLSKAFEKLGIACFGKPEGTPSVMHDEDGIAELLNPLKDGPKGRS